MSSKFQYKTFTKKCEELLIVLHELFSQHPNRVFVRTVGGQQMPFVWCPSSELLQQVSFKKNSLFSVIKFLSDHGIIVIQKPDFVAKAKTNCYAINYAMLGPCLEHWDYYIRGPFQVVVDFDPMEHIKKVPAFKQKIGSHINRKGIQNFFKGDGNNRPKILLQEGESQLKRMFQTTANPLRGYLNLYDGDAQKTESANGLSYGAARYASLIHKQNCFSLGELIHQSAILLEKVVHGLPTDLSCGGHHHRKRYVEYNRPKNYFACVGKIFKHEFFYPSRQNWMKFASWVKRNFGTNLTEALKFHNIKLYLKQIRNKGKKKMQIISGAVTNYMPFVSEEEKKEKIQYAIAENPHETILQKEARLFILEKIGPSYYSSWFSNIQFQGESDYWFKVDSRFKEDYMNQRYSWGRFHYSSTHHVPTSLFYHTHN